MKHRGWDENIYNSGKGNPSFLAAPERATWPLLHPVRNRYLSEEGSRAALRYPGSVLRGHRCSEEPPACPHLEPFTPDTQHRTCPARGNRPPGCCCLPSRLKDEAGRVDADGEAAQAAAAVRAPRPKRRVRCESEPVPAHLEETDLQPGVPPVQTL